MTANKNVEKDSVGNIVGESIIPLPTWTDAASVTSYLTTVVGIAFAIITGVHPGYTEPSVVQTVLPVAGILIAGGAQLVNIIWHRSIQKAAIVAQYAAFGHH